MIAIAIDSWNKIKKKKKLKNALPKDLTPNNIKAVLSNFYIKSY